MQLNRFAIAATLAGIALSIPIVQQNLVLIGVAVVLALASLLPVEVSLGAFAFSVPFDYVLAIGHHDNVVRVTWLAGAFAGGVLLVYGFITERLQRPPRPALWWGLFMFWAALSTAWAVDPAISVKRLPSIVTLLALYLVTVSFRIKPRELSRVLMLAVAGGVVAAVLLIYQAASAGAQPTAAHYVAEGRAALVLGEWESNPNDFGASLVLPFSLAFAGVLSRGSAAKQRVLLVTMTVIAAAIFLTMSRGALIALAIAAVVLLYWVGLRKRVLITLVMVVLPLLFVPNLFYTRLQQATSPQDTARGRLDILFVGLQIIKHNPILGTGLATFPVTYNKYAGYAPMFRGYQWSSHNTYLQAWAETGIIGFVLLLIAVGSQMRVARAAHMHVPAGDWFGVAVEAACWGVLVFAFSGDIEWKKFSGSS